MHDSHIKIVDVDSRTVRIGLSKIDPNSIVFKIYDVFLKQIKAGKSLIIFDMNGVEFPNGSFIAMLISATSAARRQGIDLQIINMDETAESHCAMFSPLAFLSIGNAVMATDKEGSSRLEDFQEGRIARFEMRIGWHDSHP